MNKKNNDINPMKIFFVIAPIIGIILGVIYIQNEKKSTKQTVNIHDVNPDMTTGFPIDSLQYYKRLIGQKDSVIFEQEKIISEFLKRNDTVQNNKPTYLTSKDIEEIFDKTFVDIACLTAKFMLNKAGSNANLLNCEYKKLSVFLNTLEDYPTAHDCIEKAKQGNYVYGSNISNDISSISNYINSISNYLRKLTIYSENEIIELQEQSLNILKNSQQIVENGKNENDRSTR